MKPSSMICVALFGIALMGGPAAAQMADKGGQGQGPGMMMGQGGMMGGSGWGTGMTGPGMGMMGGGCGMMMGGWSGDGDIETYADGRVAFLKAELGITDDQQAVWNDYADALQSNAGVMVSMHRRMREASGQQDATPSGRLDFHIEMMKSRLAALEALKPATEALYGTLSAEQKLKADRLLPVMGCM
ncbi:MAG: Spy/CpxP family protein refolding chaperone [Parvibaculum sp.]|uniref:Spy/CpxP family protein refolding chaperone n=1 Tax=Parvibaculum sp. TaxID=2024848 RepID=UPI00272543F0|nr:Spy/CpxP family protein refolding chaperone [Parvibaculum sp.]MDO8837515.1 Spy/CpxP family protein refolding chaperone [Parvibaculum sp.]